MKYILIFFMIFSFKLAYTLELNLEQFSNPQKYGWKNIDEQRKFREKLIQRQKLLQIYELKKQNPTKNMLKSLIAPGWGHFSAHFYTKGQVLLTSEIVLMGAAFYYHSIAMDYYDKYKKATYIIDINNYYAKLKTPYTLSIAFFSLGTIVWIYTIFDSAVVTRNYNEKLWIKIIKEYNKKRLTISPTGVTLRF